MDTGRFVFYQDFGTLNVLPTFQITIFGASSMEYYDPHEEDAGFIEISWLFWNCQIHI